MIYVRIVSKPTGHACVLHRDAYLAHSGGEDKQFHLFSPVHAEPVTTVAAVGPGICASGSQDKVRAHFILTSFVSVLVYPVIIDMQAFWLYQNEI